MHIGILTQPLRTNYGGLLQAWALQQILLRMGHKSTIINRVHEPINLPKWRMTLSGIKKFMYIKLGQFERRRIITKEQLEISDQDVKKFIASRYFNISIELPNNTSFNNFISSYKYDAFIVGSDQVWRPKYSPNLMTYFLDFVKDNKTVKKIAYAASFGVDYWELTPEQTQRASELAQIFDIITVRESSGVSLVKEHLNCDATHVLDPTMLLNKEDYVRLYENPTTELHDSEGELLCYIMNKSRDIDLAIANCYSNTNLIPFSCNSKELIIDGKVTSRYHNCRFLPPVEQWLKSINDAKMIITDSFHGVVFSIIFNKPFWVIINNQRGASRFRSLLNQFELEDRIVSNTKKIKWDSPIDWDKVNSKRYDLSRHSKILLDTYLK